MLAITSRSYLHMSYCDANEGENGPVDYKWSQFGGIEADRGEGQFTPTHTICVDEKRRECENVRMDQCRMMKAVSSYQHNL